MRKHIIWSNELDEYGNPSFYDLENEYSNLNVSLPDSILVIADLGLWDGRRSAYRFIGSNLRDVLSVSCGDYVTYYIDELGDIRCDDTHHDGTNHYLFRCLKPGTFGAPLLNKIIAGKATRGDITRYTFRLGDYAADVYGWNIRGRKCAV